MLDELYRTLVSYKVRLCIKNKVTLRRIKKGIDMKKRITRYLIAISVFVLLGLIWWYAPKQLLNGVKAEEIVCVEIINLTTGNSFIVEDSENVGLIMRNLMRAEFHKDGNSLAHSGNVYKLRVYDARERMLGTFEVHSKTHVKTGTFFYVSKDVNLCKDLIEQLEKENMHE